MLAASALFAARLLAAQDAADFPPPPADAPPPADTAFEPAPVDPGQQPLPPDLEDELIHMGSTTVANVQSRTGPFTVRIGGQVVGQELRVTEAQQPLLGRARRALEWTEFYQRTGHKDLARAYARRALLSSGLMFAGLAASLGSGALLLGGMLPGMGILLWRSRVEGTTRPDPLNPWFVGALGLILGGAAAMTASILGGSTLVWVSTQVPGQVATPEQNLQFMEEHNARVRSRAGQGR